MTNKKAIVLLSGGLDSATAAGVALRDGYELTAISFDYGQRHKRELQAAKIVAEKLGITEHHVVEINLAKWGGSALTDKTKTVPQDGIGEGIPITYVPGRNTVFIAIASAIAETQKIGSIFLGVNAIDYSGYPDCRPEFIKAYQQLINVARADLADTEPTELIAPLMFMTKSQIVRLALELNVPIDDTWSCYMGGEKPCGVCDSCRIRDAAIAEASKVAA